MRPFTREWIAEARAIGGISVSVTITMFAQLLISAVETLIVARLGVTIMVGVTLALSTYLLVFLSALGVVTAVTPIAAHARAAVTRRACALPVNTVSGSDSLSHYQAPRSFWWAASCYCFMAAARKQRLLRTTCWAPFGDFRPGCVMSRFAVWPSRQDKYASRRPLCSRQYRFTLP